MDKKRLLELAGMQEQADQLNEVWGEGFADTEDLTRGMDGGEGLDAQGGGGADLKETLRAYVQRAARRARRDGMEKADFDHMILELTDEIWSQFQSVRKRGDRVGATPRF